MYAYIQSTLYDGQAAGGEMLVGKRVGFSGTPSDLLPEEKGRCYYETGNDGMKSTTVLNHEIATYEFLTIVGRWKKCCKESIRQKVQDTMLSLIRVLYLLDTPTKK